MADLNLEYCVRAFKKQKLNGTDLAKCSKEHFVSLIVSKTGAITGITLVTVDSRQLLRSTRDYLNSH